MQCGGLPPRLHGGFRGPLHCGVPPLARVPDREDVRRRQGECKDQTSEVESQFKAYDAINEG
jgi:hypothetical protein